MTLLVGISGAAGRNLEGGRSGVLVREVSGQRGDSDSLLMFLVAGLMT